MINSSYFLNQIKDIFNNDNWNGKIKIIQKPKDDVKIDITEPYFRNNFLNCILYFLYI